MWELYNFSVWLGRMRSGICNHNDDHWSRRRSTIETISFSFAIFFLRQFQMLHLSQSLKQQEVHGELFPHSTYFTLHWGLLNYWYIFELTIGAHCVEQIKLKHERQSQPFPPFVHSSSSCIFFFYYLSNGCCYRRNFAFRINHDGESTMRHNYTQREKT